MPQRFNNLPPLALPLPLVCRKLHTNFVSILAWPKKNHSFFFHFVASVIGFACDFLNTLPALLCVFVLLCECVCLRVIMCAVNTCNIK